MKDDELSAKKVPPHDLDAEQSVLGCILPDYGSIKTIIKDRIKTIENAYDHRGITGVPTGFDRLDSLTCGLQNANLIILASRPSMGKTAFALSIARNAAINMGIPVAFFSLEISKEQLVQRMLSSEANVEAEKMWTGFVSEIEWPKIIKAACHLSEAPIYIDDSTGITMQDIKTKITRMHADKGVGIVFIDCLQLIKCTGMCKTQKAICRSLKALATELNIPVVVLSKLNSKPENRSWLRRRPELADLLGSGAIEADADVILFIYRSELYNTSEDNPEKGTAEIIIAKQRNGPNDYVSLCFNKEYGCFENLNRPAG